MPSDPLTLTGGTTVPPVVVPAAPLLNPVQAQAVTHPGGPLLILAGAGSGKTRVLTERIAWLIHERGISPYAILAFTFTNKAASEMRERVERRLGRSAGDMWIGTFHRICARILRRDADRIGLPRAFTIYDTDDQHALLKRLVGELALPEAQYRPAAAGRLISDAKNRLVEPAEYADTAATPYLQGLARLYAAYQRALRELGGVDFDDIINETLRLLREHPDVLTRYTDRFAHVLVDEYQDTNHAQYLLITALAGPRKNLAVVGDDDQAIYSWRGADITNILSFEATYPEAIVLRLEQNYRSTQRILDVAHAVVSRNEARREKKLWTANAGGDPVRLTLVANEEAEGMLVADLVEDARRRMGLARGQILVLYRTHAQSRAIEDGLRRAATPYQLVGGVAFYERREVKDVLAYLRLLVNPQDDVAFLRVVNVPKRGIGDASVAKLRQLARARGLSLVDALAEPSVLAELGPAAKRLAGFRDLLAELARGRSLPVPDLVRLVVERSGYATALAAEGDEGIARLENVEEIAAAAAYAVEETGDASLENFLAEAALMSQADALTSEEDRVVLMTVHNAKGLEYPVVIITGLEEGIFPHMSAYDSSHELEEERRLFYVAVTRAEREVHLLSAAERRRYDRRLPAKLSRFVEEIPREMLVVEEHGLFTRSTRWFDDRIPPPRAKAPAPSGVHYVTEDDGAPNVGDAVVHRTFGRGVVVAKDGTGTDARLTVQFAAAGRKKIVARYLVPAGRFDGD